MDLQTIENKLLCNDYSEEEQFFDDLNLVWENAMTYNEMNSIVYNMAIEMKHLVQKVVNNPSSLLQKQ